MVWKIEFDKRAEKEFSKLDKQAQKRIFDYLRNKIAQSENPRQYGKPLAHELSGYWRYRVGDYRLICAINDNRIIVTVLRVGHRKEIYE